MTSLQQEQNVLPPRLLLPPLPLVNLVPTSGKQNTEEPLLVRRVKYLSGMDFALDLSHTVFI